MEAKKCGIVILAAGNSSRLGKPKQLLGFNGKNLLQHAIDTAVESGLGPVLVVLGAHYNMIQHNIHPQPATIILNDEWQEGMASSIRRGVNSLQKDNAADGAIFMVCDQPYISTVLLKGLLQKHEETGKPIVASTYAGTAGIPAFFHRSLFPALLALEGDAGAKKIMLQHAGLVAKLPFEAGNIDIDTLQDYDALNPAK